MNKTVKRLVNSLYGVKKVKNNKELENLMMKVIIDNVALRKSNERYSKHNVELLCERNKLREEIERLETIMSSISHSMSEW